MSSRSSIGTLIVSIALSSGVAAQSPTVREGTTTAHSTVHVHYLESGSRTATRALVLIPGWRLPAFLWTEQLTTFASTTRVIAIDPRSQGPSTVTSEGNSPESRAADLHEILSNLGVAHAVLVGWSQGAQDVAAYLAAYGTQTVDGVVLVDSPVSYGPAEVTEHAAFAKVILSGIPRYEGQPEDYSRGMVRSLFAQPHPDLDIERIVRSTMRTPPDIGIAMLVMDIFGADRRPPLAALDKPALVIASAASPLLDVQQAMASSIPSARFVVVQGAGHAVFVDQPAQFDTALRALLQAVHY
jgi:non-heme chloroperoxidase